MMDEDIIVGSGPAGVAAAHALLAGGRKVRMLDAGETLEPERADRLHRMGAQSPDAWTEADLDAVRGPRRAAQTDGMRPYGSDFAVRDIIDLPGASPQKAGFGLRPSFALGGLSNGWGAATAPYRIEDIQDWPEAARDLAPHYRAVSLFMPIAARDDGLQDVFPLWRPDSHAPLPLSSTAAELLFRLERRSDELARAGVRFGQARQAVRTGCRTCGMCLYGCPYKLIFNAGAAVTELQARPDFSYEPDLLVVGFEEQNGRVRVRSIRRGGSETAVHEGARLFVAAGVLPTAKLVLSQSAFAGQALTLLDSQQMLLPMLHQWKVAAGFDDEQRHTLTQAFVEIMDSHVSSRTVHVQIYTFNDLFPLDMRRRFGRWAGALAPAIDAVCRRLVVAQAFLHSDESARIRLRLVRGDGAERLECLPEAAPSTAAILDRVKRKISSAVGPAGLHAISSQARVGVPGSSFHCGGTLPMRDSPSHGETDVFGRPAGFSKVHIVDASVLPSIPATTITFSVMANAHRIASTTPG